jgi:hypothetical protein
MTATAPGTTFEFQLQLAVPAEELHQSYSLPDLRRLRSRVDYILSLAAEVSDLLEPRGWRILAVRFDHEVCVILSREATAAAVVGDLAQLPRAVRASIGKTVHLCATVGEHVFELGLTDAGLQPVSLADSRA